MIYNVSLNVHSYNSQFASGTNKLVVPVNPSAVIYSQFDHVSGVAARQGQSGISVNKIRILNTLLDQLITMKRGAVKQPTTTPSDTEIDEHIRNYQTQISALVKQSRTNPYILPGAAPESGALFSIGA
jgi:repressor of nif and glnA expression